jgi:hypothetical protein
MRLGEMKRATAPPYGVLCYQLQPTVTPKALVAVAFVA